MAKTHSKFRNTSILFELLVRKIASDTISGVESGALNIIKEFFNKKSEISKELELHRTILEDKFQDKAKAEKFLDLVLEYRKKIDEKKLSNEKYQLVKKINETFDAVDFFKARVSNYKILASLHVLFESAIGKNLLPKDIINSKYTILEHITTKPSEKLEEIKNEVIDEYMQMDEDIRLLAYKMLVDKFNSTFGESLNEQQKLLLQKYINNITDSTSLREYVDQEIVKIKVFLAEKLETVEDDVTKIKLKEVTEQIPNFLQGTIINENHILSLLRYYSLVDELTKLN